MKNLVFVITMMFSLVSSAASLDGFYAGLGLYAQNSLGKTTKAADGAGSFMGAFSLPVSLRYVYEFASSWSAAPTLFYTPIGRASGGTTATTTFFHLSLPASLRLSGSGREFELFFGPGISMYQIKGAGGTKTLNNGTTTSTFAVPGGSSTSKLVTLDFGGAWVEDPHRLSLEAFVEGAGSSEKRSFNVIATYMYHFGGRL